MILLLFVASVLFSLGLLGAAFAMVLTRYRGEPVLPAAVELP